MPRLPASKRNRTKGDQFTMDADAPIGMIGLGLIGAALSMRLLDAKIPVLGFDIDAARCKTLKASGGMLAPSLRDLASRSPAIVIAVYDSAQVEAVFDELANQASPARPVMICTTTCAPDEIERIARRSARAGYPFVEAPISGTSAEVRHGSATALVAGDTHVLKAAGALLALLCPRMVRIGSIGDASRTKLAINLVLQNNRAALAEGIAFAEYLGLDGHAFLEAARASAAYSSVMDTKGMKMLTRDFRPQSHLSQTLKDAELILEQARLRGLPLPVTSTQADLLRAAILLEGPDSDSSAVIEAIRRPALNKVVP
jgi:3-hydroxyisobutyrate dehydrogenase-like beta-hydroxyacid dehydrogenase